MITFAMDEATWEQFWEYVALPSSLKSIPLLLLLSSRKTSQRSAPFPQVYRLNEIHRHITGDKRFCQDMRQEGLSQRLRQRAIRLVRNRIRKERGGSDSRSRLRFRLAKPLPTYRVFIIYNGRYHMVGGEEVYMVLPNQKGAMWIYITIKGAYGL
jgi:hypothetical protein